MRSEDSPSGSVTRRGALKRLATLGSAAVGMSAVGDVARAGQEPAVIFAPQTAEEDTDDADDYPVPDAFRVSVLWAQFNDVSGTLALPVKDSDGSGKPSPGDTFWYEGFTRGRRRVEPNTPGFVVGLHSPAVGSGEPNRLDSLIGVRPLPAGAHLSVSVPVWAGPPPWQRKLGADPAEFPTRGDTIEVTATLWYGPDVFPPTVPRGSAKAIAQTPEDERNGPARAEGELVSSTAEVEFGKEGDRLPV